MGPMASRRTRLRDAYRALVLAPSYDEWLAAAQEHDRLTGAHAWRAEDESPYYDARSLREVIARWRSLREAGDALGLAEILSQDLYRHLNDLADGNLYDTALTGPKRLVEEVLDEAETSLRWLADTPVPGLSTVQKLHRFETAWAVFGRSALLLSGGATWGFHHFGVVKALFEAGLLPHILSGASTGAMIAAGVCTRDDAELAEMFADTSRLRLDGLVPTSLRAAFATGALLDPERLYEVLRHNVGDSTFAEAFAHSGRALNISVSPTRTKQKPHLLSHLTSPEVLVARAALASSALPALFPPVELAARGRDGAVASYLPGERWVDGSLHGDLPKRRLSRLHNVNHFIVSQTNPHVLPFLRHYGRRGVTPAVVGIVSASARTHGVYAADLARRATRSTPGPLHLAAASVYALASQDYRGDIDLHPQFRWTLYRKMISNPSRDDLAAFIREGERGVWPKLAMIRNQTRIGRAFRACVEQLRSEVAGVRSVAHAG